jgi:hypothetical protein
MTMLFRFVAFMAISIGIAWTFTPTIALAQAEFAARSYCGITGATGIARGRTAAIAIERAINTCVREGGIAHCCRSGTQLIQSAPRARGVFAASAHCRLTGATGFSAGQLTASRAIDLAISQCVRRGGILSCCQQGASLR